MAAAPTPAAPPAEQADTATAPRTEAARKPAAEAQTLAGAAPAGQAAEERVAGALAAAKAPAAPVVLAAPGGQVLWRIAAGVISRSDDGGRTWREQVATGAALTTGAAVSPTVCWAAGRAGAVWRTTDGERWEAVASPAAADLTSLTATDAAHATVTTADGRLFETADGGRTWTEGGR
jgi:photosystem II stability/assembly factor-like uncharacterized protein